LTGWSLFQKIKIKKNVKRKQRKRNKLKEKNVMNHTDFFNNFPVVIGFGGGSFLRQGGSETKI